MKTKKILLTALIATGLTIVLNTDVQAVQSRPNVDTLIKSPSEYFALIRQMETSSGPMGLNATVDSSTGTETSKSNNIDVHMVKNTEWGTAAMLAASPYGAAANYSQSYATEKTNGSATTGNVWGIYQMADPNTDCVASIWDTVNSPSNIYNADAKYKNKYTSETSILGDATLETALWRKSTKNAFVNSSQPVFVRGYSGIFGYGTITDYPFNSNRSRAAVVCGNGF